jgi:hypothetical protein
VPSADRTIFALALSWPAQLNYQRGLHVRGACSIHVSSVIAAVAAQWDAEQLCQARLHLTSLSIRHVVRAVATMVPVIVIQKAATGPLARHTTSHIEKTEAATPLDLCRLHGHSVYI